MQVVVSRGLVLAAWVVVVGFAVAGHSTEPDEAMRRVDFQVERSREIANDRVRAIVGVTDEGSDAAALADRVNRTMAWALETARAEKEVEVKSGGYHTSPVYEKGTIRRWRASQDLILEGSDVAMVSGLIGKLQERLALRSISFTVSPARRRAIEDELIKEALAAFKARAEIVRTSLDARGWEIVRLSINTRGGAPPIRPAYAEAQMRASVAPPALEAGSSTLSLSVNGTIELE